MSKYKLLNDSFLTKSFVKLFIMSMPKCTTFPFFQWYAPMAVTTSFCSARREKWRKTFTRSFWRWQMTNASQEPCLCWCGHVAFMNEWLIAESDSGSRCWFPGLCWGYGKKAFHSWKQGDQCCCSTTWLHQNMSGLHGLVPCRNFEVVLWKSVFWLKSIDWMLWLGGHFMLQMYKPVDWMDAWDVFCEKSGDWMNVQAAFCGI